METLREINPQELEPVDFDNVTPVRVLLVDYITGTGDGSGFSTERPATEERDQVERPYNYFL